jgi:restriction system protein
MSFDVQDLEISPAEFERQVVAWLRSSADGLKNFSVTHLGEVSGSSGEYEMDAIAEFEVFGGALVKFLVECKRYKSPIKRDVVMVLDSKLRDTGAQKGLIFSTSGFQKGAIQYAAARGIATVTVRDGKTNWITKSMDGPKEPPPWVKVSRFIGWFTTLNDEGNESFSLIDDDRNDPLAEWLRETMNV